MSITDFLRLEPAFGREKGFLPSLWICSCKRMVLGYVIKRLIAQKIPETQEQMGDPQYPGQRHKPLPLSSY